MFHFIPRIQSIGFIPSSSSYSSTIYQFDSTRISSPVRIRLYLPIYSIRFLPSLSSHLSYPFSSTLISLIYPFASTHTFSFFSFIPILSPHLPVCFHPHHLIYHVVPPLSRSFTSLILSLPSHFSIFFHPYLISSVTRLIPPSSPHLPCRSTLVFAVTSSIAFFSPQYYPKASTFTLRSTASSSDPNPQHWVLFTVVFICKCCNLGQRRLPHRAEQRERRGPEQGLPRPRPGGL